jgi:hypothetical protein
MTTIVAPRRHGLGFAKAFKAASSASGHGRRRAQPWYRSELDRLANPRIVVVAVVVAAAEVAAVTVWSVLP